MGKTRIMRVSDEYFKEVMKIQKRFEEEGQKLSIPQITNFLANGLKKKKKKSVGELLFG